MTDAASTLSESRIVITIDSNLFSDATIEYAVSMAARLKRPLHGIFIEDTDLLSSAGLPFTREICMITGEPRDFDSGSLESAFHDILSRFQQRLAQRAESKSVRWSVSSQRGRRRDFHLNDLAGADYYIYERGKTVKKTSSTNKHILVIDGSGEAFYQTLAALLTPLEGDGIQLTLVQITTQENTSNVKQLLPEGTQIDYLQASDLAATLQQSGNQFDYVVISRRREQADLASLLAQLSCPLIVVD